MTARSRRAAGRHGPEHDDGHVAIEAAIAVIGLLLVMWLFVGGLRLTNAEGDVRASARAAARAAAVTLGPSGEQAARDVAETTLANRGVSCQSLAVAVERTAASAQADVAGLVKVSVSCTVSLGDVALAGFAGTRRMHADAIALVDVFRGGA